MARAMARRAAWMVLCFAAAAASAGAAAEWPQFRGPGRDGVSRETGLLSDWAEGGPALLWEARGLGRGYSSPAVCGGALFITGDLDGHCRVHALDLAGKRLWSATNGAAWKGSYPGSRASVTLSGGALYHMNAHGRVACLSTNDGREVWAVNVLERFEAPNIVWGLSECLLVDGERVLVTPGGPKALMAALARRTGATLWATEPLRFTRTEAFGGRPAAPPAADTDKAGYASPVLFRAAGRRLIAGASARHVFCVDADAGKLVWTHPVPGRYEVIGAMPCVWGDAVYFSAPDAFGGALFRAKAEGGAVAFRQEWQSPVDNCHGAMVAVGDCLYGSGYARFKPWSCIALATGQTLYSKGDLAIGSALYVDGRLYALGQNGRLLLLEPGPGGFQVRGGLRVTDGSQPDVWAHPVVCGGRLYLRYHDTLRCYDVRRPR